MWKLELFYTRLKPNKIFAEKWNNSSKKCTWLIFCWCILLHTRSCVFVFNPHISMFWWVNVANWTCTNTNLCEHNLYSSL
jgi:hypothetical protein